MVELDAPLILAGFADLRISGRAGDGLELWSAVLFWLGIKVGANITPGEMHKVTFGLLGFLAVFGVMYYFFVHGT